MYFFLKKEILSNLPEICSTLSMDSIYRHSQIINMIPSWCTKQLLFVLVIFFIGMILCSLNLLCCFKPEYPD
jgi:hypothetical protein